MNSLLVVQKKSNLKLIKKNQGKNINYICFAFISHVDIAYNIYIRILGFLFIIVLFFSCLRSDIFSQDLPKKPHSFFPSNLDFGRVGEKEKMQFLVGELFVNSRNAKILRAETPALLSYITSLLDKKTNTFLS